MLTDGARVRMPVKVCLLISVICKDCIKSHGPDDGGNTSSTKNYLPCQCRVFTIGCGGSCYWCLWCWFHDSHQLWYLLHQIVCHTTPFLLNLSICRIVSPVLSLIVEWCSLVRRNCTHLPQLLYCHPYIYSILLLCGYMTLPLKYPDQEERPSYYYQWIHCTKRHIHCNQSWRKQSTWYDPWLCQSQLSW